MWESEERFALAAQQEAELLFESLNPKVKLSPKALVIGTPRSASDGVYVLPEEAEFPPSAFAAVHSDAQRRFESFKGRPIRVVGAGISSDRYLWLIAIREAVLQVLNAGGDKSERVWFCSLPAVVMRHYVSVALSFNRCAYDACPSLSAHRANRGRPFGTSLLACAKDEFLAGCQDALRRPDPGHENNVLERDPEEVLRAAGKRLVDGPVSRDTARDRRFSIFRAFDDLSSRYYERREGKGALLISRNGHPNVDERVALARPAHISNRGAFRKLFEMASDKSVSLLADWFGNIRGVGSMQGVYNAVHEDLFEVRVVKHHTWQLVHNNVPLMEVEYGIPRLHKPMFDVDDLQGHLQRLFHQTANVERLTEIVRQAAKSAHGTTLVICENAADEAKRLQAECWAVSPTSVEDSIEALTAIDGAILFDPSGVCHAIGVILDGATVGKGTPARGARYNSAIRYVGDRRAGVLVIVVSADGMVNLIPTLKPKLARKEIADALGRLCVLDQRDCMEVNALNRARGWFEEHRGYLAAEVCAEVNAIWRKIVAKFPKPQTAGDPGKDQSIPGPEALAQALAEMKARPFPFGDLPPDPEMDEECLSDD